MCALADVELRKALTYAARARAAEVVDVPAVTIGARAERAPPTRFIYQGDVNLNTCGDKCPILRPRVNGIDFWESLEGQKVTIKVRHTGPQTPALFSLPLHRFANPPTIQHESAASPTR